MRKILILIMSLSFLLLTACQSGSNGEYVTIYEETTMTPKETTEAVSDISTETDMWPGDAPVWGMKSPQAKTWIANETRWAQIIIPIHNFGLHTLVLNPGTIQLKDRRNNKEITLENVQAYPQVLKPEEDGYYYVLTALSSDYSSSLDAELKPDIIIDDEADCIRYEISDCVLEKGDDDIGRVSGTVKNNTDKYADSVFAVVVFYNENKEILSLGYNSLGSLETGEEKTFKIETFGFLYEEIHSYDVFAFPIL